MNKTLAPLPKSIAKHMVSILDLPLLKVES